MNRLYIKFFPLISSMKTWIKILPHSVSLFQILEGVISIVIANVIGFEVWQGKALNLSLGSGKKLYF